MLLVRRGLHDSAMAPTIGIPPVVDWPKGILFEAFPSCFQAPNMCVGFFIVWSMMAPARIGVCLICRAKLVHKKKDFGRGHVYRIIAGD